MSTFSTPKSLLSAKIHLNKYRLKRMAKEGQGLISILLLRETLINQPKSLKVAIQSQNSPEYVVEVPSIDFDLIPRKTKNGKIYTPATLYFKEIKINQGVYHLRVADELYDVFTDIPVFLGKVTPLNAHFLVQEEGVLLIKESQFFINKQNKYLNALQPYFYHIQKVKHSNGFKHRALMHVDFRGSYEDNKINKIALKSIKLIGKQNIPIEYLDKENYITGAYKEISHGQIDDDRGSRHHSYYNFVFSIPSFKDKKEKCFQLVIFGNKISKLGNKIVKKHFDNKNIKANKVCLKNGDYYPFQKLYLRIDFKNNQFKIKTLEHQTSIPIRENVFFK
ncbi:MAG: hypothetical protein COB02_15290 [Candidatus Cloacimonadota bacterium]|nr:MAG: hypothetical protein COB02_15290 [Candidatus Cloacimonadota bacterium]